MNTQTLRHPIFDRPDDSLDVDASAVSFVDALRAALPGTAGVRLDGYTAVITGWTADMQSTLEALYDDGSWLRYDLSSELTPEGFGGLDREELIGRIALAFARDLHTHLSPVQWTDMLERNASPDFPASACASHDFLDANESMSAAFEEYIGRLPVASSDEDAVIWTGAWSLAKATYLTAPTEAGDDSVNPQMADGRSRIVSDLYGPEPLVSWNVRQSIIRWIQWNDRNASVSDYDQFAEYAGTGEATALTLNQARAIMLDMSNG